MAEDILSMEQMTAMLDNIPVAVSVSEVESRKILYINRYAKEMFPEAGIPDTCCYTVAGFDKPCSFCRAGKISRTDLMVREYEHPVSHHIYQLSGKLIDWAGKEAHIEYILDVTGKRREEKERKESEQEMLWTFENISCGLCIYEIKEGGIFPIFHNHVFYDIMGYSEENIRLVEQRTNYLNVHPQDVDVLKKKLNVLFQSDGFQQATYRVWHDKRQEYRWIHLEATARKDERGRKLLYGVYSDVSEQKRLEKELTDTNEKLEDVINAIPGGVAIYKVSDIFETVYYSDGVPEMVGYTAEEYREAAKGDAVKLAYQEDAKMVTDNAHKAIREHSVASFEFRKVHRDGHLVWVHVQARQIGEEDGFPLLQCVFHNISDLKETQLELDHLVNSIPGGIASFCVKNGKFKPVFFSDGVAELSGYTREEYAELLGENAFEQIYSSDQPRVNAAVQAAMESNSVLDISYRVLHKSGRLIWIHLNGRRMGPQSEATQFYAVFTNMLMDEGTRSNEMVDGIYIINKENYELLYISETERLAVYAAACVGKTCYRSLHKFDAPCEKCVIKEFGTDNQEHMIEVDGTDLIYTARAKETVWNGIPAYIMYIRDVTEEVRNQREKERAEMYFQTLVKNLPGGIAVIRSLPEGGMMPEYISEGFAAMSQMTVQEIEELYRDDIFKGVHPEDVESNRKKLHEFAQSEEENCELTARFRRGDGSYIWVRNHISMLGEKNEDQRFYCIYTDISKMVEEQIQLRGQYEDLIIQHYRTPEPDTLILGHCNITQNRILEIWDSTQSDLLQTFGRDREGFFTGIASLIVDEEERQTFLNLYLNEPSLAAFYRKETEKILKCFIKLPTEDTGRYVQFKINMVETPDTGDVTGILSVTDVTDQTISGQILNQMSVTSHEYVIDLNLRQDSYTVLTCNKDARRMTKQRGSYSEWAAYMAESVVVPKDREAYANALSLDKIEQKLQYDGLYTYTYSMEDENGAIRVKTMTVSAVDLRLGRVSLVCTDITSAVREQQNLLSMLAYTFELATMINVGNNEFVMYTRKTVLENLTPYVNKNYDAVRDDFVSSYVTEKQEEVREQFRMETILRRLQETPGGYEFIFPCKGKTGQQYKQINVIWGGQSHETICMVRADVTDMLMAERQAKNRLEQALAAAEEANRAKSDFLSAMSHDIRTPMNAIMGMTELAPAHLDNREWMADYLQKISISSKHLLSLINDVLDMSRIEQEKITLNRVRLFMPELTEHLAVMMSPQAEILGLQMTVRMDEISHPAFYGDSLRVNQILINLMSNAVKFTPKGGKVDCLVEEIPPAGGKKDRVRYRFSVRDTGIGMPKDFLQKIFEPFTRGDSSPGIEGTGLGLSIVRGLVDLMQGEISVESELEKGTVFRVELEFEAAQEQRKEEVQNWDKPAVEDREKQFGGRCFLIVEDNELNADILREILETHGAKTETESDGIQAVRAFREKPSGTYDAILMDIQMPNMNGYEAARTIRALEHPDARVIPIIALTANAFSEDIQTAMDAGMNAHVAKPIDVEVLKAALNKVLEVNCDR